MSKEGLYIGRSCEPASMKLTDIPHFLKSDRLTRHAVCFGMTGSGKTGLCVSLLEELAMQQVPLIVIDPKGDMANLALGFSEHQASDFEPWVDHGEAERRGVSVEAFAAETAAKWREGLEKWGVSRERVQAFTEGAEVTIYTPGSQFGCPVDVMSSLQPPSGEVDDETMIELVAGTVSGLLGLLGIEADPVRDARHIVMSTIVEAAWREGSALSLEELVLRIVDPPFAKVGVFPVDTFFPRKDRMDLAMRLNGVVASPSFSGWKSGVPLDPSTFLSRTNKTPVSIFYLAHLDDQQRMFFVSLLLNRLVAWSRRQPGTGALRALLYFDEVFGYLPPYPKNPASKGPMMTLMKQARAVGLGTMVVTQNPVDVDYAALSNSGLWLIGRLQTKQDRARVLDGLELSGSTVEKSELDDWLEKLPSRCFLVRDLKESSPALVHSRWAISYLRGPLTRREVERLGDGGAALEARQPPVTDSERPPAPSGSVSSVERSENEVSQTPSGGAAVGAMPPIPSGYTARYLDPEVVFSARLRPFFEAAAQPRRADGATHWRPALFMNLELRFDQGSDFREMRRETRLFFPITDEGMTLAGEPEIRSSDLMDEGVAVNAFDPLPKKLDSHREFERITKRIIDRVVDGETTELHRHRKLGMVSRAGEGLSEFRARVKERLNDASDDEIRKLQKRHASRVERLEERRSRLVRDARAQKERADSDFMGEIASAGDVLLGSLLGGRRRRGALTSVIRSRQQSQRSSQRFSETQTRIDELEREIYDLEREVEQESESIRSEHRALITEVETVPVRLEREDIRLLECMILWVPVTKAF